MQGIQAGFEGNQEFELLMIDLEMKGIQSRFQTMSQKCFDYCVTSFRGKDLSPNEESCIKICSDKFFNITQRTMKRCAEIQARAQESAMKKAAEQEKTSRAAAQKAIDEVARLRENIDNYFPESVPEDGQMQGEDLAQSALDEVDKSALDGESDGRYVSEQGDHDT